MRRFFDGSGGLDFQATELPAKADYTTLASGEINTIWDGTALFVKSARREPDAFRRKKAAP
jgi:hypothetical protein